jgi:acyl carrier protein
MSDSTISERIKHVIINVLDLNLAPDQLHDELPLYSATIRLDSLTLLQLVIELEKVFSCRIDDEAVMTADLIDVASIVTLVASQLESQ